MIVKGEGYVSAPEFQEDKLDSLFDIQFNKNTELWLLQLPDDDEFPDIDGKKLTLDLDQDGELGSVTGPDGTVYSLVNFSSDVSDTTVFQPTPSGTKIAGKISRHVSLVHYPEPKKPGVADATPRKRVPLSSKTTFTKSQFSTPTRTTSHKNTPSRKRSDSIPSSSGAPKSHKRGSSGISRQSGDSGPGHSGVTNSTYSGSSEQSHHKKSKTKA